MAIKRSDIIKLLCESYNNLPCHKLDLAVKEFFSVIGNSLIAKKRVELRNFGIFSLRYHEKRLVRNPKTGETKLFDPRFVVHFKAGKELNAKINQDLQDLN